MKLVGVGCGALLIDAAGKILLLQRGPASRNEAGCWARPGGAVEFGETVADAVRREVREELGVEIELLDNLGWTEQFLPEAGQHWVSVGFCARIVSGKPRIREPEKTAAFGWFAPDELPAPLSATTAQSIREYMRRLA
jgi:8-oxo-dGTP diphosphatase